MPYYSCRSLARRAYYAPLYSDIILMRSFFDTADIFAIRRLEERLPPRFH